MFKRIDVTDIKGFKIGNAENLEAGTGCTVIISEEGAVAGMDVRGGAPATRETDLLKSERTVQKIHAVVLSGGSAFGLDASSGVIKALEDKNVGFGFDGFRVPIVCQASLFDLGVGRSDIRPDKAMGLEACMNAYAGIFEHGNHGAGTGATVGKFYGMERAMKAGLGTFACSDGVCDVGAITAVNAFADVYDGGNHMIAGLTSADHEKLEGTINCLKNSVTKNPKVTITNEQSQVLIDKIKIIKDQLEKKIAIKSEDFENSVDEIIYEQLSDIEVEDTATENTIAQPVEELSQSIDEIIEEESTGESAIDEVTEVFEEPVVEEVAEVIEEPAVEEAVEVIEEPAVEETIEAIEEPVALETVEVIEEPVAEEPVEVPATSEEIHHEALIDELKKQFEGIEIEEPEQPVSSFLSDTNTIITESAGAIDSEDDELSQLLASISQGTDSVVVAEEPSNELTYEDMGYNLTFNTTLACLITNAKLTKTDCNRLASILHDGYARAIKPVHSTVDGDTIFVMTTNEVEVNFDAFAALATDIIQYSVIDGVLAAEDAYGLHSASYFKNK